MIRFARTLDRGRGLVCIVAEAWPEGVRAAGRPSVCGASLSEEDAVAESQAQVCPHCARRLVFAMWNEGGENG